MVWVRLAQPAQQAPPESHSDNEKSITLCGDIRGDFQTGALHSKFDCRQVRLGFWE